MFSAFVDLYLAIYPGLVLVRLGIKRKKKIALTIALGLGCMYVPALTISFETTY